MKKSFKMTTREMVEIAFLIALAVVGLSLFVINFIPVTHKVDVNQNNIQSITLYQNSASSTELWKDTDEELFNKTIHKVKKEDKTEVTVEEVIPTEGE